MIYVQSILGVDFLFQLAFDDSLDSLFQFIDSQVHKRFVILAEFFLEAAFELALDQVHRNDRFVSLEALKGHPID